MKIRRGKIKWNSTKFSRRNATMQYPAAVKPVHKPKAKRKGKGKKKG
jgi:hypothetical protein